MNKRTIEMIKILDKIDEEVTLSGLSEHFNVSSRTIRNDINAINETLTSNGLSEILLQSGGRVCRAQDFINLLPLVSETGNFYDYKLSRKERIKVASVMLVSASGYITLSSIADSLFVSRSTVINELEEIKQYIRNSNMNVISHANKGLLVVGKESQKRRFLIDIVRGNDIQKQAYANISIQAGNRIIIQKIVNEQEHVYKNYLSDYSFQKLMIYLGIMVNRNLQGEFIETQPEEDSGKFMMAQSILRYVSQYCHINTTEDEIRYLAGILDRCKYIKGSNKNPEMLKIQTLTRHFIESISGELGINLEGDYDFFESLSNHLTSVFTEIAPVYPENNIVDEVLAEHPDILKAVHKCLPVLKRYVTREIQEIEIGYIALHICAALERKKNKEISFHVVVACHAGIGTSQLLLEKLKRNFNFKIVDIISSHEAKFLEEDKADLVISTIKLEGCKIDHVVVSPLLTDQDYIRVGNKIDALRNSRKLPDRVSEDEISAKGLIDKLTPVIYDAIPDDAPDLMKKIRRVIREYFDQPLEADAEIFSPALHHLLPCNHIRLDVECTDWKDAVRKASGHLLRHGYIEERYIDSMIQNVEENGPYIVVSPGFAIPHDAIDSGSIKVGMSMIRLKDPVPFGEEEFDPVEFVCVLSAVDHKTHLKAFFNLINMLQTETFKEKLHECKTPEEAAKIIEEFEYSII